MGAGFRDPVTGDRLTAGEMASRLVQRIIRRWIFLGTITAITAYLWLIRDPIWRHSPADSWNYFLSWLAIAIENVVGMFFFAQSLRDALIIRTLLRMEREHGEQLRAQAAEIAILRAQVAEVYAVVVGGASVRLRGPDGRFVKVREAAA